MKIGVLILCLVWQSTVFAGETDRPIALPANSPFTGTSTPKIVNYDYDANRIYAVVSMVDMFTELLLPEGEQVVAWFPSADEKRGWPYLVSGDHRRIMIMPRRAGLLNSGTLVSNLHSYLLSFQSVANGEWDQRVSWMVFDVTNAPSGYEQQSETPAMPNHPVPVSNAGSGPTFANMNVAYSVEGKSAFAPEMVADDGRSTWFRLPQKNQEIPALFVLDEHGIGELVNYVVQEKNVLKAQRTSNAWLLKLGDDEVTVRATDAPESSTPAWFR